MGACCSNRDSLLPDPESRLSLSLHQSKVRLSELSHRLQKLNLHLTYFHHKNREYKQVWKEVTKVKEEYLEREMELRGSVERMNELLGELETEVQAQYISERESTDITREELIAVIQTVRAQKQADKLERLSNSIKLYLTYSQERVEFHSKVNKWIEEVKITSTSLLGYMKFVEDCKATLKDSLNGLEDISQASSDEKLEEKVRKWESLRRNTRKTADDMVLFSQKLINSYEKRVDEFETLKREVDEYFEKENQRERASEVQASAQKYLGLIGSELKPIPRRSRGSTGPPSPLESGRGSVYMEEYQEGLRRLCILNHYRDGDIMSSDSTYSLLTALFPSKAAADHQCSLSRTPPLPLEIHLLCHFATLYPVKTVLLNNVLQFTASLDSRKNTPLGELALELLKFTESTPISIHEESCICKSFSLLRPLLLFDIPETWSDAGFLTLYQAIKAVEQWFFTEPEICGVVISGLLPTLKPVEIAIYYIKSRLAEMEKSPEDLFYELDTNKSNNLQKEEFIEGVRRVLNVKLPSKTLEELSELLDKTGSNCIFRTELMSFLDFTGFSSMKTHTSCLNVISSLRNGYIEWKSELSSQLYLEFILIPLVDYKANVADLGELVRSLDPELSADQVEMYLKRLEKSVGKSVNFESFREFFLLNPLGKAAESYFGEG